MCNSTVLKLLYDLIGADNIFLNYISPDMQKAMLRLYFEKEHNIMIHIYTRNLDNWCFFIFTDKRPGPEYAQQDLRDYDEALKEALILSARIVIQNKLGKKECVEPFNILLYNIGEEVILSAGMSGKSEHNIVGYFKSGSYCGYVLDKCPYECNPDKSSIFNEKGENIVINRKDLIFACEEQLTIKLKK